MKSLRRWLGVGSSLLALGGCTSEDGAEQSESGGAGGGCAAGWLDCDGRCVDPLSDAQHCGRCGAPCAAATTCQAGVCRCQSGYLDCGGACVNPLGDASHCGSCDVACVTPQVCSQGACTGTCASGEFQCGQSCVDLRTDELHCGGCDAACAAGQDCVGGACLCPAGRTDCADVCVDLLTDPANCGRCGATCPSGTCASGACTPTASGGAGGASGSGGAPGDGGSTTGGVTSGGVAPTGGAGTGGVAPTGGIPATGGVTTGGVATGGATTGGSGTGGLTPTGGGGAATGGVPGSGGADGCQPCGSHKWACWRMPNPPGTGPNPQTYTVSDGVVHDELTCLDWEESPSSTSFTAAEALAHCEGLTLGGYDDWRAPTRVEMASIVDFTANSSIDPSFTAAGGFHKTGSNWILTIQQRGAGTSCGNGDCAWAYNMSDGIVSNAYSAATAARIRCVRGNGAGEGYDEPAVAPPDQYTLLSDDEARDNYTRLVWQRDGDATGLVSWEEAQAYCEGLTLGGADTWRLPTIRELATLVDEAQVAPAINREVFPNTHYGARSNNWYWASHRARGSSTASWGLNFDDGFTGANSGSAAWNTFGPSYTKCVRDE